MKTEIIIQSIVSRFKSISEKSKVVPKEEHIMPTWGLVYRNNGTRGLVTQFGTIERNGSKIDIVEGKCNRLRNRFI